MKVNQTNSIRSRRPGSVYRRAWLFFATFTVLCVSGLQAQTLEPQHPDDLLATVNEHEITRGQFQAIFNRAKQQEFYHRTPLEGEVEAFLNKTLNDLIDRLLLIDEAKQRGIEPDQEKVEASLTGISERYESNPEWQANKEEMLASVRNQLEGGSRIEQIEALTREAGEPSEAQLMTYYEAHPDTFTEPRQRKVSLILFQVDPSATQAVREQVLVEAERIVARLADGEDFAMLAEAFSMDNSAEQGGSMGWLHEGLLNDQAEKALNEMTAGEISAPVRVLEGYAILRLDEVREPVKHTLERVRERATGLWQRDEGERQWQALIKSLRSKADINIIDSNLNSAVLTTDILTTRSVITMASNNRA